MRYYIHAKTAKKIKDGWPIGDCYLAKEKGRNTVAIDIAIVGNCFSCGEDFILEEKNEHAEGDFCNQCLKVHGD